MYGAELIFEENYLGGAGRDGHTARGHRPDCMVLAPWSRPDQVSSGFGLVTSFDVAARDGRFKRTSITSPKPGTPTVSALTRAPGPAASPQRGRRGPEMAFARPRTTPGRQAARLRGAGPGDTVTSAANPQISNLQITIRRPPAPCNFATSLRQIPRFHADFNVTIPVPYRPPRSTRLGFRNPEG